jgi:hypothetical protein
VLKGSSRVFDAAEFDWKRFCERCVCVLCAQKMHGAARLARNGDMDDCVVEARSRRVAVERIDRMLDISADVFLRFVGLFDSAR